MLSKVNVFKSQWFQIKMFSKVSTFKSQSSQKLALSKVCRRRCNKRYGSTSLLTVTFKLIYIQGLYRDARVHPTGLPVNQGCRQVSTDIAAYIQRWADHYFGLLIRCPADYRNVSGLEK
jgi:hypothetical protein